MSRGARARPLHFRVREIEMASHTERVGNTADQVEHIATTSAKKSGESADSAYPLGSLLVLGAVVIGGGMLAAAMLRDDDRVDGSGESRRPMGLAAAARGMGPRVTDTLSRIRDAAFSFAIAKAIDTVEEMFPGFREHYERA
jgi:hypothetical protein